VKLRRGITFPGFCNPGKEKSLHWQPFYPWLKMLALSAINLKWWFRSSCWVCEKVYYVQSKGNIWQYNICKDINTFFL